MKKILGMVLLAVLLSSTVGARSANADCISYYKHKQKNKVMYTMDEALAWMGGGAGAFAFWGACFKLGTESAVAIGMGALTGFTIVAAPAAAIMGVALAEKILDIRWKKMHRLLVQAKKYSESDGENKPGLYLYRFYRKIRKKNFEYASDFPTLLEVADSLTASSNNGDLCVDNKTTLRDLVRDADYFIEF